MLYGVNPIITRTYTVNSIATKAPISVKTIDKHEGVANNKTNLKYKSSSSTNKKSFKEVLMEKVNEIDS